MTRFRLFLIVGLVALAGLAAAAPSASAVPEASALHPSCLGTLSSFAGPLQVRDDFAPEEGATVAFGAQQHLDFNTCLSGVPTG